MIYFIQAIDGGPIKIGFTDSCNSLKGRLSTVQVNNYKEMVVVGAIDGTLDNERHIHKQFSYLNIRGEWFINNDELIHFIDNCITKNNGDLSSVMDDVFYAGVNFGEAQARDNTYDWSTNVLGLIKHDVDIKNGY